MGVTLAMSPEEKGEVMAILEAQLPPEAQVGAFGSRAAGNAKPWADLDLALRGPEPISLYVAAAFRETFEVSSLGWKVDIVDRACVSREFDRIIESTLTPLR